MGQNFNHFDSEGNAIMVDVTPKEPTSRMAVAEGIIKVSRAVLEAITGHTAAKGDVLGVARVAGIMATKHTSDLIPLCHPLALTHCAIEFRILEAQCAIGASCTVKLSGKTGVEMEALTGVTTALLTIYDMCKAMDKTMELGEIHVVRKEGGKSGLFQRPGAPCVVAISGVKNSGKTTLIENMLPKLIEAGHRVAVVKHDGHTFLADPPGTDTGRHLSAGACGTAIFDGEKYKLVRRSGVTEEELIAAFPDADLILLEGFKHSHWPKVELVRGENSQEPVCDPQTLLALMTDLPLSPSVPRLAQGDTQGAVQVILDYVKRWRDG